MKKIVCIGDSITYGFPYGSNASWTRYLGEATGHQIINRGINGNTTSEMIDRFDRHVIRENPDWVTVMGGTNDVVWRESIDRITWNLREMIEKAEAAGIKVVLGLLVPVEEPEMEARVTRIRSWTVQYAREHQLPVIDFYSVFIDDHGFIRSDLLLDGAHPTEEGYRRMFDAIPLDIFSEQP